MGKDFARLWLAALYMLSAALVAIFGFAATPPGSALAYSCGSACHWHMFAKSGAGANGTRGTITTPSNVYGVNTSNDDSVVINIWMWGSYNTGYSSSIEAGVAYGYDPYCDTFTAYFHPYGTKDDGGTGVSACGTNVGNGNTMLVSAYHDSASNAYSAVQGYFSHNWGNYTDAVGYDNQSWFEVWSYNGNASPSWSTSTVGSLQWANGSNQWSYWGYLNTSTDDENGCHA